MVTLTNITKTSPVTTTNVAKSTTTVTNIPTFPVSLSNIATATASSITNLAKNTLAGAETSYLLQQDAFFLLLQNNDKILLTDPFSSLVNYAKS